MRMINVKVSIPENAYYIIEKRAEYLGISLPEAIAHALAFGVANWLNDPQFKSFRDKEEFEHVNLN